MNVSRHGNPDAGVMLIQPVDDEGIENEVAEILNRINILAIRYE